MANPVAKVNGVEVFSDKEVKRISGPLVMFWDGSWCDVETGETENKGQGFIKIGASSNRKSEEITVKGPFTFSAGTLEIRDVMANVKIEPGLSVIEITIEGPKDLVEKIEVREDGDTAIIEGKKTGGMIVKSGNSITHIGNVHGAVIGRGGIFVGGNITVETDDDVVFINNKNSLPKITVIVPEGTEIDISDISGGITEIGNTYGPVRIHQGGASSINIGEITNLSLRLSGAGSVHVASVKGNVRTVISGSGKAKIDSGSINDLEAEISGAGRITIGGTAKNADLSVSGVGSISVKEVVNRPQRHKSGVGSISVGNWD